MMKKLLIVLGVLFVVLYGIEGYFLYRAFRQDRIRDAKHDSLPLTYYVFVGSYKNQPTLRTAYTIKIVRYGILIPLVFVLIMSDAEEKMRR